MQTAAAKWPLSDRAHKVQHFRCQACQGLTLKYLPPNDRAPKDARMVDVQSRIAPGAVRENPETLTRWILAEDGKKSIPVPVTVPRTVRRATVADVVVRCTDKSCGAVMDSQMFELAVAVIKQEQEVGNVKR